MTKFFFKFKKPYFLTIFGPFPQFWGQKKFFHEIELLYTTSEGFLAPCQISEKPNDPVMQDGQRWKARMDRPYFIGSFQLLLGV